MVKSCESMSGYQYSALLLTLAPSLKVQTDTRSVAAQNRKGQCGEAEETQERLKKGYTTPP